MSTAKEERYTVELAVHASRHDQGVRSLYEWLKLRQSEMNTQWPAAPAEEVPVLQGEAKLILRLLRLIETGPSVRPASQKPESN